MSIKNRIANTRNSIPASVSILGATKGRTLSEAQESISCGIGILGENYVQEAQKKYGELREQGRLKAELHLIGHLQKNKVDKALEAFDCIQSVDSFELAEKISNKSKKDFPILIQINIGEEPQKYGCKPEEAAILIKKISSLQNVRVMGLMAMAPFLDDPEGSRPYFRGMKALFEKIRGEKMPGVKMEILSMGMSHDYRVAIEEGATMVRLGGIIFGK